MFVRFLATCAALVLAAQIVPAQSATTQTASTDAPTGAVATHIALGDSAHSAMKPVDALSHYQEALAADSNSYAALWRAARESIDLGEFEPDKAKQKQYYADGEKYARHAVAANANDPEGHFQLARALGRVALTLGAKERVRFASDVRAQALAALAIDSLHPGALHVMGRWNAEVMRLSGISRFFAKNFLGGDVFSQASWDNAVAYMEASVRQDPARLVHHLDLAEIYRDRNKGDDRRKAREQFEAVVNGTAKDYNDRFYKQEAEKQLAALK
jgi:hypothetical protein